MNESGAYILIVDDDPDDQDMIAERFLKLNPDTGIKLAANGFEALSFLRDRAPDELPRLILVDYKMPILNGYEFLLAIRNDSRYRDIVKLAWSTSNVRQYIDNCMEAGALRYFVKPSDIEGLDEMATEMSRLFQSAKRIL